MNNEPSAGVRESEGCHAVSREEKELIDAGVCFVAIEDGMQGYPACKVDDAAANDWIIHRVRLGYAVRKSTIGDSRTGLLNYGRQNPNEDPQSARIRQLEGALRELIRLKDVTQHWSEQPKAWLAARAALSGKSES